MHYTFPREEELWSATCTLSQQKRPKHTDTAARAGQEQAGDRLVRGQLCRAIPCTSNPKNTNELNSWNCPSDSRLQLKRSSYLPNILHSWRTPESEDVKAQARAGGGGGGVRGTGRGWVGGWGGGRGRYLILLIHVHTHPYTLIHVHTHPYTCKFVRCFGGLPLRGVRAWGPKRFEAPSSPQS